MKSVKNTILNNQDFIIRPPVLLALGSFFSFFLVVLMIFSINISDDKNANNLQAYVISNKMLSSIMNTKFDQDDLNYDYYFEKINESEWTIISSIENKNTKGNKIKTEYIATIKFTGGNWRKSQNWQINDISFNNKYIADAGSLDDSIHRY